MGQKINPLIFRVQERKLWSSQWYAEDDAYSKNALSDSKIREYFKKKIHSFGLGDIVIERAANRVHIILKSGKTGAIIGRKGKEIENMSVDIQKIVGKDHTVSIKIEDLRNPDVDADIVCASICDQIHKRGSYKKASKGALDSCMRAGAFGIKITCSGRLNGAEIARSETFKDGSVPLHSIRANIDYSCMEAKTTYGIIGVKVWIHRR